MGESKKMITITETVAEDDVKKDIENLKKHLESFDAQIERRKAPIVARIAKLEGLLK